MDRWIVLVLLLLFAGLGLTAYFDLAGPLPMSDEWMFWFPLQSVHAGHGFQLWPGVLPLSLVQLALALPLASASPELWRLTELPFLALAAACAFVIGRRLGAGRFWAAAAATTVVCAPVTLSVATGFTSDIAYVGLVLLAALLALRWLDGDSPLWPLLIVAGLATLQRQHGIAIVPALAAALLAAGRRDRRAWLGLVLVGAVVAAALVAPFGAGITTRTMNGLRSNNGRLGPGASSISATIVTLMPMLGVFFLPLIPGLLGRPADERRGGRVELLPVAMCSAGVAGVAGFAVLFQGTIWPGNVLGIWGLGPTHVGGYKPPLLGIPLFLLLELLSVGAFLVILGARRRQWNRGNLGTGGILLVVLGLAHLLFMPFTSPLDRYFIPVVAAMAPVLAVVLTRVEAARDVDAPATPRVRAAALLLVAGGLAMYAVGEQDYQAWQGARERAALLAYTRIEPARLEAGYEAVAHHAAVPEYLRDRRISIDPIDLRPAHPVARLEFAPPTDPRPGAGYVSVSPGKVVIVCLVPAPACPFAAP